MDYLLYRCSGTTFCHYTRRFERACVSFLMYHNLIPEPLKDILKSVAVRPVSNGGVSLMNIRYFPKFQRGIVGPSNMFRHSGVLRTPRMQPMRFCHAKTEGKEKGIQQISPRDCLILPQSVLKRLENLHKDISEAVSVVESGGNSGIILKLLAVVSEMIHAASLVHDDVIDEAERRRNRPSLNAVWGNKKVAILVGDYILAKATQVLCSIGDSLVIRILAQVIEDLVKGEFMQMGSRESADERFVHYMSKTFKKTASLFAHSCQAVASLTLPRCPEEIRNLAFEYGRNLGLAFQLVDDLLDFVANSSTIGKPVVADLKLGLATAPVLFAAKEHSELEKLIVRRFSEGGDVEKALELVMKSDGLLMTRQLAETHSREAVRLAKLLPHSAFRTALCAQAEMQLNRVK